MLVLISAKMNKVFLEEHLLINDFIILSKYEAIGVLNKNAKIKKYLF